MNRIARCMTAAVLGLTAAGGLTAADSLPLDAGPEALRTPDLPAVINSATWMSLDIAPDGESLVFDLLGDLYRLPAEGGAAEPLMTGMAYESQPVFSPDGRRIAFISDRDGNENLWVAARDGGNPRALSEFGDNSEFTSPAWAADGESVFVSRIRPDTGAFEIREYDLEGGDGLVVAGPDSATARADRISRVGAAASPDGRYLYFAARTGFVRSGEAFQPWRIHRLDLETGRETPVITRPTGAVRPVLSPDGRMLLYASRKEAQTELRLRDLESGADRRLTGPVQADQQTRWATQGLMPRPAFTPGGRHVVHADADGLHRVAVGDGMHTSLDFEVRPDIRIGPDLRRSIAVDDGPVQARLIQAPALSPDGEHVAFSALGRIYRMRLDDGEVQALTPPEMPAFHPAWSPHGNRLAFVTWHHDRGGHVWMIAADGGQPERLSPAAAFWTRPVFEPGGDSLLALHSPQSERLGRKMEYGRFRQADLVRLRPATDDTRTLASGAFAGPAQFVHDSERIHIHAAAGLESMAPDGSDRRTEFRVTGRSYYFQEGRDPVQDLRLSPDGRHALAVHWSQLHLIRLPAARGETPVIDLDQPSLGQRRITRVGADFADWNADGDEFGWATGSTWYQRPLASVDFDGDSEKRGAAHPDTRSSHARVTVPRDVPEGTLVLRGATAITMRDDEIIERADVVIEGNRIAAIGSRGSVDWPDDAEVMELEGRFVVPGFIDAHAHWADVRRDVLDLHAYGFLADLSFGITAGLDVSPLTIDMLAYQDLIESGRMLGPRVFSTGPAVFSFNDFGSRRDALDVLGRYADHYRVDNLKQYRVGNRRQRQWFAQAARELELMPTTEGADNFKLSMTQLIDGFAGIEHSLPATGLGDDVIGLLAASQTAYVPTLTIADEAAGIGRLIGRDRPHEDPRIQRFIPEMIIDVMTRWQPARRGDFNDYVRHAEDARRIHEAGGLVAAGSHGEFPGIGLHWEMQALAEGGIEPHEVLRIATLGSSRALGRAADLGSIAPGKLADIVVLDKNPLSDIANARSTVHVIKNGRVYRADTLEQTWPERRPAPTFRGKVDD